MLQVNTTCYNTRKEVNVYMTTHITVIPRTTRYIRAIECLEIPDRDPSILHVISGHLAERHTHDWQWRYEMLNHIAAWQAGEVTEEDLQSSSPERRV